MRACERTPSLDRSPIKAIYFVVWVLAGGMVLVNLFVGVLVETFAEEKGKQGDVDLGMRGISKLMDEKQQQWAATFELMLQIGPQRSPPCPSQPWRAACWRLVRSPRFDQAVLLVILFNTLLMGMDGYHIPAGEQAALRALNLLCTLVFIAEAGLKIAALSLFGYLADGWNAFDFAVVCVSLVDLSAALLLSPGSGGLQAMLLRILRLTRILRTMRAIKSSRGLRTLFTTLFTSLPLTPRVIHNCSRSW